MECVVPLILSVSPFHEINSSLPSPSESNAKYNDALGIVCARVDILEMYEVLEVGFDGGLLDVLEGCVLVQLRK